MTWFFHADVDTPAAYFLPGDPARRRFEPKQGWLEVPGELQKQAVDAGWTLMPGGPPPAPAMLDHRRPLFRPGTEKDRQQLIAPEELRPVLRIGKREYLIEGGGVIRVHPDDVPAAMAAGCRPGPFSTITVVGAENVYAGAGIAGVAWSDPYRPENPHRFVAVENEGRVAVGTCSCGHVAEGPRREAARAAIDAHVAAQAEKLAAAVAS